MAKLNVKQILQNIQNSLEDISNNTREINKKITALERTINFLQPYPHPFRYPSEAEVSLNLFRFIYLDIFDISGRF